MAILPTDAELIELVKQAFKYNTDLELAGFLGVSKDTVSAIRNNRTVVGEGLRFTILDKLLVLDKVAFRKGEEFFIKSSALAVNKEKQSVEPIQGSKRSLILLCSPAKLAAKILELRQAQHERWALKELEDGPSVSEDALLLDLYMAFKKFETDSRVAEELGIKRNSISMVRHGRSRLGPLPRLRIYRDVYGQDISELEAALESSEALLDMLKKALKSQ